MEMEQLESESHKHTDSLINLVTPTVAIWGRHLKFLTHRH